MAKEFPYFRFDASEWIEGDITLETDAACGLFVLIMSWYWKKNCTMTLSDLDKRITKSNQRRQDAFDRLVESNIIKLNENNEIHIHFLDEQFDILSSKRLASAKAGRSGGLAKAKRTPSYKDKDKDKDKEKKDKRRESLKTVYGQFKKVSLKTEEYSKIIGEHGEFYTLAFIKKLDEYKESSGKKYKSDYAAILSWVVDEVINNQKSTRKGAEIKF